MAPEIAKSKQRRRLLIVLGALVLGALAPEIALRFLLFNTSDLAQDWGRNWRKAGLYTVGPNDSNYWKLLHQFESAEHPKPLKNYDAELGWITPQIHPETYRHKRAASLKGRRPILLYGASFANGSHRAMVKFEGLLEQSEHRKSWLLLNYGVGGYGLDQMLLLYQKSIGHYLHLDPIVIFGPVIESDLDRAAVDFRVWPKPHFKVEGQQLVLDTTLSPSSPDYIEHYPHSITSFAWNYILRGTELVPDSWPVKSQRPQQLRDHQAAVTDKILDQIQAQTEANGHTTLFLLFHTADGLEPAQQPIWEEQHLQKGLGFRSLPWVDTRPYLLKATEEEGVTTESLYVQTGASRNHPTAAGNLVLLDAIIDGAMGIYTSSNKP